MLYPLAKKVLFQMTPETAHHVIMSNLDWVTAISLHRLVTEPFHEDPVTVMGLRFRNRIGLAAGMDKEGSHVTALGRLGFGHIEVGTVTPRPQPGNPKPRCWRLIDKGAVVNYMGFNNPGCRTMTQNLLRSAPAYRAAGGVVGVNIGKQTVTPAEGAVDDFVYCMREMYEVADYLAIDVSCPNVHGLTCMQAKDSLDPLLSALRDERERLTQATGRRVPVTVKIGPDLDGDSIRAAADLFVQYGMDAVTATNTTTSRAGVEDHPDSVNKGGLSGRPLFERSTEVVRILSDHLKGEMPIIAVGGVMSADDAVAKVQAGASLVQLYTGFIFTGPGLIGQASRALAQSAKTH